MKIAFYAPLKSPDHAVPSGDRLMARQLVACLGHTGHAVTLASQLRAFCGDSDDGAACATLKARAGSYPPNFLQETSGRSAARTPEMTSK